MVNNEQSLKNTLAATRYMTRAVLKKPHGREYMIMKFICALIDAAVPIFLILFPGMLINELLAEKRMNRIILYVLALCLIPVLNAVIRYLFNKRIQRLKMKIELAFSVDFYTHVAEMDFETNEMPQVQRLKDRAQETLTSSITIVDLLLNLISAVLKMIAVSALILSLNPIVLLVIVLQVILSTIISKKENSRLHELDIQMSSFGRSIYAATCVFNDSDYAKELRLFDTKDFFINLFQEKTAEENSLWEKVRDLQFGTNLLTVLIKSIQQLAVYAYLVFQVIFCGMSIGDFTIYLTSVNQLSEALSQLFSAYVEMTGKSLKIDELIEFFNIPNRHLLSGRLPVAYEKEAVIEFRNVSFQYPGAERYALKNLNLKIDFSERLCIVGENGSGKTTFIKLLTRLYEPTEGEILMNGKNIKEYDYKEYLRLFAPVFQDFQLYFLSLKQNVTFNNDADLEKLRSVYEESYLAHLVDRLPYADDTQVYKWECENGFEPSGGEGQRIAIARALYHGGEIYILDEPTAALDPNAEYEIYTQFNNMIQGKTAIMITHRLAAVQLADKVAVFSNGQVAEYGTHKELYAKGGIYTDMYDKQAKFYREEPCENT